MNIILYILATILGVFGIWTICLNWKCFWYTYVKKEKVGSWIPIVPGALLMIAFILLPNNFISSFAWIGLFVDWGCLPGFTFALVCRFINFMKSKIK